MEPEKGGRSHKSILPCEAEEGCFRVSVRIFFALLFLLFLSTFIIYFRLVGSITQIYVLSTTNHDCTWSQPVVTWKQLLFSTSKKIKIIVIRFSNIQIRTHLSKHLSLSISNALPLNDWLIFWDLLQSTNLTTGFSKFTWFRSLIT